MNYKEIITNIKAGKFAPIYLLHGEEPYYIDKISDLLQKTVLEEHERDFNQTIVYGKDSDPLAVVSQAKQFPMMSERQIVMIREAQDVKKWELFESYFNQPLESTVLIICNKYGKFDKRKKAYKAIEKNGGVIFQSDKVKDYQVSGWIMDYLKELNYTITDKAMIMLVEFLGTDLSKITNELNKLSLLLEKGTKISEVHVEENIGISKDYNVFELSNAIAKRDILKSNKIAQYFEQNPKVAHITMIIPSVFSLFQRLMKVHFMKGAPDQQIASALRLHPFAVKEAKTACQIYSPKKIAKNIEILLEYDLKAKGVNRANFTDADILRELLYKLMH